MVILIVRQLDLIASVSHRDVVVERFIRQLTQNLNINISSFLNVSYGIAVSVCLYYLS